jgi:hypothetical protein
MNECSPFSFTVAPNIHSSICGGAGGTTVNFFFLLLFFSCEFILFFGGTFAILGFQLAIFPSSFFL